MKIAIHSLILGILALAACAHNNRAGGNNAESDSLV